MRKQAAGKIQSFDQSDRTIVLEGGLSFTLAPPVDMTTFRPGDFVRVEYDEVGEPHNPDDQRGPTDAQRFTKLADVVAKSSPEHPDYKRMPGDPHNTTMIQPAGVPRSAVNTTASLQGREPADSPPVKPAHTGRKSTA